MLLRMGIPITSTTEPYGISRSLMMLSKLLFISIFTLGSMQACKNTNSGLAFDWDTDLVENDDLEDVPVHKPVKTQIVDGEACRDKSQPCFTLLINIPTQTLISDQGLALLSLASESKQFESNIKSYCKKGIQNFVDTYKEPLKNQILHPLNMKISQKLAEMGSENRRCVINYFADEDSSSGYERIKSKLSEKDFGISVRLTKFQIKSSSLDSQAGLFNFLKEDTQSFVEFRDIRIYGRSQEHGLKDSAGTMELDIVSASKKMDSSLEFNIDFEKLKANMANIDLEKISSENVKTFISKSQSALASMSGDALAMLSFGIKTVKNICADNQCSIDRNTENTALEIALDSPIPTDVNEKFRLASIRMVESLLRTPIEKGYGMQFKSLWLQD